MQRVSRRVRACAVVAVTGICALAGSAGTASAQRPDRRPVTGCRPGQMSSVQMFNYGGYLNNGGNTGRGEPDHRRLGGLPDLDDARLPARASRGPVPVLRSARASRASSSSATAGFPAEQRHPGPRSPYRALLDKYGLHAGGWHGAMSEAGWDDTRDRRQDPRRRRPRLGRHARPGHRQLREHAARPPRRLNRLGKYVGRERRRPASTSTTTSRSSARATSTTASSRRRGRSSWSASTRATSPPRSTPSGPRTPTTT